MEPIHNGPEPDDEAALLIRWKLHEIGAIRRAAQLARKPCEQYVAESTLGVALRTLEILERCEG